jgi:lipopolysaccharide/colanic/teichoic acid biosynthesis glycosyltransferase
VIDALAATASGRKDLILKTGIDRFFAVLLLLILSPLLAVIAALVRATSHGPIIHRRRVVGLFGNEFDAFKFRTMVADADQVLEQSTDLRREFDANIKLRDDPRRTTVGRWLRKTSLDELPQLVNVLRGEMSLVGPRMIAPDEMPKFGAALEKRLSVKPGLTGLWQVSGRQELDYSERIALDLHYVDNRSLWLDLTILLKTIPAVLSMRGAY